MLNHATFTGRLTKDPVLNHNESGCDYVTFDLAVDRDTKKDGEPKVDFIPCRAFRNKALFLSNCFCKGMKLTVTGRLEMYTEASDDGKGTVSKPLLKVLALYPDGSYKDNADKAKRRAAALKPGEPVPTVCEKYLHHEATAPASAETQDTQLPD